MKIRIAKIEDIPNLLVLFMEQEKTGVSYLPPKYKSMRNKKKPLKKHIKLALKKDIKQKNSRFLVMEDNKKIVGYIFGEIRESNHILFKRPKSGELSDIAVLKTYQGKGIAGKLWKELLDWFTKKKCKVVTLNVNSNNPAQEIYKKWGFDVFYFRMIKKV